jgi:hypothetical protein
MTYFRNRKTSELKDFLTQKRLKRALELEEVTKRKEEKVKRQQFRKESLVIDKFLTIDNQRMFISRKAFARLVKEAKSKWKDLAL